jgi:serine/threonine protein kinase
MNCGNGCVFSTLQRIIRKRLYIKYCLSGFRSDVLPEFAKYQRKMSKIILGQTNLILRYIYKKLIEFLFNLIFIYIINKYQMEECQIMFDDLCGTIPFPFQNSLSSFVPSYHHPREMVTFLDLNGNFWSCNHKADNHMADVFFLNEKVILQALIDGPGFIPKYVASGESPLYYHILLKYEARTRPLNDWNLPSKLSKCDTSTQIFAELTHCYGDILNLRLPINSVPIVCYVSIFKKVIEALAYIHSRGYFHGNIRTSSILICPNGDIQLTNFELSGPIGSLLLKSSADGGNTRRYYPDIDIFVGDDVNVFTFQTDRTLSSSPGKVIEDNYNRTYKVRCADKILDVEEEMLNLLEVNHCEYDCIALGVSLYRCLAINMPSVGCFERMHPFGDWPENRQLRSHLNEETLDILEMLLNEKRLPSCDETSLK